MAENKRSIFGRVRAAVQAFKAGSTEDQDSHIPAHFKNKWAVLIGINKYKYFDSLNYACNDAKELRDRLINKLEFPEDNILCIHDEAKLKPDRSTVLHELPEFLKGKEIGADDLLIFFFSGHGQRDRKANKDFLLPSGATENDLAETAIQVQKFILRLEETGCKNIALFLDACRNSDQFDGAKSTAKLDSIGDECEQAAQRSGIVTFFSCLPEDRSYELHKYEHGSFTHCLLNAIDDGSVNTVADLDAYLSVEVPLLNTKEGHRSQKPYAIVKPTIKKRLEILFSSEQLKATEQEIQAWKDRLADAEAANQISPACLSKAVTLLDHVRQRKIVKEDQFFFSLIDETCRSKGDEMINTFEVRWQARERKLDSELLRGGPSQK